MKIAGSHIKEGSMGDTYARAFLDTMIRERWRVKIFIVNGYPMTGQIMAWDQTCLIVEIDGNQQMVMRSAVSTIVPLEQSEGGNGHD